MFEKSCQFQVHRMRYRLHPSCPEAEVSTYSTEFDGSQDFSNTLLAVILCLAYTIHVLTRWQSLREYSDIHGSARWAKRSDILINQDGVYVGEWKNGSKI